MVRLSGPAALFMIMLLAKFSRAGNTTCASRQLDWYTDVVGENPCVTYERLRQICNIDYQVPSMPGKPPGDHCDDQVSECCCNTIAFYLSMLCLNCQQDTTNGYAVGIDAPIGTYQKYLNGCPNQRTLTGLPADIQAAVCNQGIRLDDFLYGGWDDGSWFYVYTKENAGTQHAAHNNNTFTHCQSQVSSSEPSATATLASSTAGSAQSAASSTQSTASSTAAPAKAASTNTSPSGGTIAGIVIAILAVLGFGALALWLLRHRRRNETRSSRPYRWSAAQPQMAAAPTEYHGYASKRPASNTPNILLDQYSPEPSRLVFSPDAMVRQPTPAPFNVIPGRSRPDAYESYGQGHSRAESHDDSRVQDPIDDTPDPAMPLQPLRLEPKEGMH
ncbi:hypothetical protein BD309DRAFT_954473 [Dichomitus squalens]|uniref:Uncharacterized protein n=1 Tax=Dichomitus squalens TaxID=114155 RepID=A0A4Q9PSK5_9APHY|nr:hypothetical protein BD309DRAFT_954473 [Dichomitus squalens]TBU57370.1 hypothetical protein BD310DRAFT_929576 [Dichomitus squalens]